MVGVTVLSPGWKHSRERYPACPRPSPFRTVIENLSTTTDFIAELVRAANETERLTATEVVSLLDRAINTIGDLRNQAGITPIDSRDSLVYVHTVSAGVERVPREEWYHALLHAADMIRDLHIVLDSGTLISISR